MNRVGGSSKPLVIGMSMMALAASIVACSGAPSLDYSDPTQANRVGGPTSSGKGGGRDGGLTLDGAASPGDDGTTDPTPNGTTDPAPSPDTTKDPGAVTTNLPKHALIGYWHNFGNPSGPAFPLGQVSNDWDVIDVAFASNATPSGSMAFQLDPSLDEAQFKADVAAKRAAGKKVVLSLGGQDGTVSLNSPAEIDNFVNSLSTIIKTYGFDGVDIDLETGAGITQGAAVQTNLVTGIKRIKANTLGSRFFLSMAPEHPYVQGAFVTYAGIWGSYLPIIEGLRDDLTILHVQLYNDGDMPTPWGTYHPTTEDLLVGAVDMLLGGFQTSGGPFFKALRADQVAFGIPSGNAAANAGNFATVATIEAAFTCVTTGASCGAHKPSATYPDFRGVMTWSINWDKHDGPASFSQPLAAFLHGKP